MKGNERFDLKGYEVIEQNRKGKGDGILLGMKEKFKLAYTKMEVKELKDLEWLWIEVGTETKICIGIIYAPRETS